MEQNREKQGMYMHKKIAKERNIIENVDVERRYR
jgi:hypothetical protein